MQDWKRSIEERLTGLALSPTRQGEILEELSQHLEDRYRELLANGLDRSTAYAATLAELDGSLNRELRRVERPIDPEPITLGAKGGNIMKDLLQDIRYGLRILRKNPGFATVAILSLALGIGANTAIFQLFDAVFLRTLPVQSPERIAEIKIQRPIPGRVGGFSGSHPELTFAQWEQIRDRQQGFSGVFAWSIDSFNLSTGGEVRYARGLWVSGDFFNVLGIKPLLGRVFTTTDDRRGCGTPGAVISYAFWQREFAGDPAAIGKTITLSGNTVDVIGVTPSDFAGLEVGRGFDVAMPICSEPVLDGEGNNVESKSAWWLDVMGRLKPGWSIEQATAQLAAVSPEIFQATLPSKYTPEVVKGYLDFKLGAFPADTGLSQLRASYGNPLYLIMGLAGLVLLIACANLANLLLARASSREKEIAVRLAIGASRGRLVRQLLSESLLVAVIGATAGAVLGGVLSRVLVAMLGTTRSPVFVDLAPDLRVIGFLGGLALLTCLLFGLVPAIRASRNSPALAMRSTSRGLTADQRHFALRRALVVCQVALSLVLLVGALLFSANLRKLLTIDAGFRQDGVISATLDFTSLNLPKSQRLQFKQELLERVRAIPGVDSAADVLMIPMTGNFWNEAVRIEADPQKKTSVADFNRVSSGYFKTMAIPILAGRDFNAGDTVNSPPVAVVDEQFAKKMLGERDPIGSRVRVVAGPGEPEHVYEIIGLARATKYDDIHEAPPPIVYVPDSQDSNPAPSAQIMIHSDSSLANVVSGVKQVASDVNPSIDLNFRILRTTVVQSLLRERLLATLSGFFGLLAVLLACVGLYGVMSYGVTARTGEIGIRMALGAKRYDVIWMILKEALLLVGVGIVIGLPAVLGSIRLVSSLLYGPDPTNPVLIAAAAFALIAVAALAAYSPARRASRTDPMNALRYE